MNEKYLNKLEYNKILKILSGFTKTYIAEEICFNLTPVNTYDEVLLLQRQTNDAIKLYNLKGSLPISPILDISIWVKSLESYNTLGTKYLLEVSNILKIARELKSYYELHDKDNMDEDLNSKETSNSLYEFFSTLYSNSNLEEKISKAIIDENNISDNASSELSSLRRKRRKLEQSIKEKLNSFIHSSSNSKYLQEPIITIRNERFVVPIKGEYRSFVKGFIHDISSSGSTVFIEPISIFQTNNEINNLKLEEAIEIEKILKELSKSLFPYISELKNNISIITTLDFIFAKAMYSLSINGICPILNKDKYIKLVKAKHPLIDPNIVVPIDINIGNEFQTLVITGPNTGGKTVSLKTVGLLTLMGLSGLNIPASEDSTIYVFDNIFADIGDDQNISESLSTFSSHMLNIIDITKSATSNSLILLDELGSGTDPEEGSCLAISLLEYFKNLDAITIATTHYPNIKKYAIMENGFQNASFEFDLENLRPTYKIFMGIPGKSNAFEISKKLGLDENILINAKKNINADTTNIEELLKNIYDDNLTIQKQKEEILKNSNQIELLRKILEKDKTEVKEKQKQILESAKAEARKIILDAKDNASSIIKQMNDIKYNYTNNNNTLKDLNNLRNTFNEDMKKLNATNLESSIHTDNESIKKEDIKIGINVYVNTLNKIGKVLSLPNKSNEVQLQIGGIKTNISINNISRTTFKKDIIETIKKSSTNKLLKAKTISPEINLIGFTINESIPVLDKYLDDSSISNLPNVRIVHGKGTGALKNGIHQFLKKHPHVKSFRLGTFGEGEMGVTIVELK